MAEGHSARGQAVVAGRHGPTSHPRVDALSRGCLQRAGGNLIRRNRHSRLRHGQQNVAMALMRIGRGSVIVLEHVGKASIAVRPAIHGRSDPTLEYRFDVIAG
jgi:hypothetical protein